MAYTPKTWVTGDTVDAAQMNNIDAGITQAILDVRTRAFWDSSTTPANVGANTFATVQLPTIDYNVGGGSWASNQWTVPVTGLYFCTGKVRIKDSDTARSVGIGIHTTNADGPHFTWRNMGGVPRDVYSYVREAVFTQGDQLRLYIYSETTQFNFQENNPGNGSRAEITIRLVRPS